MGNVEEIIVTLINFEDYFNSDEPPSEIVVCDFGGDMIYEWDPISSIYDSDGGYCLHIDDLKDGLEKGEFKISIIANPSGFDGDDFLPPLH